MVAVEHRCIVELIRTVYSGVSSNTMQTQTFTKLVLAVSLLISVAACDDFDSTKIIEPTTFQINAVSLNMPRELVPTNVAAQKVNDNEQFTLVGATFSNGQDEYVGIWLFDESDPEFIKSVNEVARSYSPFPTQEEVTVAQEADNLTAFLQR